VAKIPEKVGKYKILSQIGKGGMGVVYAAEHPTLKRKIILKKLTIRDREFRERFRLEADMMMDLRSDYIVDMYDHFREGSSWYIAMEYIDGMTLEELIKREGPLELPVLIHIMVCTARALEYIHQRGIVHRDIKPSNIYISRKGEVKLGDFGIASSSRRDVKITDSGTAMGTPAYMAPEQFDDSSTVGPRADLFSLGVSLFEALTGNRPFRSESYTELKQEIRKGKFPSPGRFRKDIPLSLKVLIRRSLSVRPFFRPPHGSAVRKTLEKLSRSKTEVPVEELLSTLVSGSGKGKKGKVLTEIITPPVRKRGILPKAGWAVLLVMLVLLFISGLILGRDQGILRMNLLPLEENSAYRLYSDSTAKTIEGHFGSDGRKSLFLKEGSYRVRVENGSTVLWRSLYISPFLRSGKAMELTLLAASPENLPLLLDFTVRDRFSGVDLRDSLDIRIKRDDSWEVFNDSQAKKLKTGSSIQLSFRGKDYMEEMYTLNPLHHQTQVNLDVLLTPLPASLTVGARKGEFRINGRKEYFSPRTLVFEPIPSMGEKSLQIELLPGSYELSLKTPEGDFRERLELKGGTNYNFP